MTTAAEDTAGTARSGRGEVVERRGRADGFKVLGTWVVATNRFSKEIREREKRAWCGFFAVRQLLEDTRLAVRLRYHMFRQAVEPAMLWAARGWALTQRDRSLLRGRNFCISEGAEAHMGRANRIWVHCLTAARGQWSDAAAESHIHKWAVHLAKMAGTDAQRLTTQVFRYGYLAWVRRLSAQHGGRQNQRALRVWRWQLFLCGGVGADWQDKAQNREAWAEKGAAYVRRRARRYAA